MLTRNGDQGSSVFILRIAQHPSLDCDARRLNGSRRACRRPRIVRRRVAAGRRPPHGREVGPADEGVVLLVVAVVLDQGRLVEQGTHQELITAAGWYADLYSIQATAYATT
jgi:hypothetical protein